MEKKLYRDERRKVIAGVCAGLADYFGVDVSIVRLVFVLTLILKGGGGLVYIVLWIVLPKRDYTFIPPVDYTTPPADPFTASGTAYQSSSPGYRPADYQASYQAPVPPFVPRKGPSTAGLIGGLVLILLGAGFLLDEFNIIPDWNFEQWWPLILVVVGIVLIITGRNKNQHWQQAQQPQQPAEHTENTPEEPLNDNPSNQL